MSRAATRRFRPGSSSRCSRCSRRCQSQSTASTPRKGSLGRFPRVWISPWCSTRTLILFPPLHVSFTLHRSARIVDSTHWHGGRLRGFPGAQARRDRAGSTPTGLHRDLFVGETGRRADTAASPSRRRIRTNTMAATKTRRLEPRRRPTAAHATCAGGGADTRPLPSPSFSPLWAAPAPNVASRPRIRSRFSCSDNRRQVCRLVLPGRHRPLTDRLDSPPDLNLAGRLSSRRPSSTSLCTSHEIGATFEYHGHLVTLL